MLFGLIGKKNAQKKSDDFDFSLEKLRGDDFQLKAQLIPDEEPDKEEVVEIKKPKKKKKKGLLSMEFGKRAVTKDKQVLLDNMALLISSGMGVNSALRTLYKNSQNRGTKKALDEVIADIENGEPLWQAMDNAEFLPVFLISLIKIGEESGNLADKIRKTVISLEKEQKRKAQLRTALFYPVFVLTLTVTVGLAVSIFVLPRIGQVFTNLDVELPVVTQFMINTGNFLGANWYIVVPGVIIGFASAIFFGFIFPKTKGIGQWILFHAPVFNTLITRTEVARFCYNLSMLITSGVPITRSLQALVEVHDYYMYKRFVRLLAEEVKQGKSFHKAFEDHKKQANALIPFTAQEIITSGEESGKLPQVLDQVGIRFEGESEQIAQNIAVLLEPVLLIIVWIGVVFLAVSILLPIYNLVGNFNI